MHQVQDITKHSNDVETAEIKSLLKRWARTLPYGSDQSRTDTYATGVISAQEEYDKVESQARAQVCQEVGKDQTSPYRTNQHLRLFMRYTAASAETYLKETNKLLKTWSTIRDSKRRLSGFWVRRIRSKNEEAEQAAG